jgi:hypothetical protein
MGSGYSTQFIIDKINTDLPANLATAFNDEYVASGDIQLAWQKLALELNNYDAG